jgi:hypothetical protein
MFSSAILNAPWPPKPDQTEGKPACKATASTVTYELCTSISTSARNRACRGCPCNWRICTACVVQRARGPDIRNINPETGLCAFHAEKGREAIRPIQQEERVYGIDAEPRPRFTPSPLPKPEPVRNEADELKRINTLIHRRLNARQRQIVTMLVDGKGIDDIAHALSSTRASVDTTILNFKNSLEISVACVRNQRQHVTNMIKRAYRPQQ